MLTEYIDDAFYVFVTMLAMLNPIQSAAAFATLTEGRSAQDRAKIAWRATLVAGIALLVFAVVGEALLRSLGVEIGAFKIAGGLLLLRVAFDMVLAPQQADAEAADRAKSTLTPAHDPSVFPLAIPIITGPGALTAAVALIRPTPDHQLLNAGIFVVVTIIVIFISYVFMRGSEKLTALFGETGIDAVGRIVGIIIAAIAVQLIINGVAGLTNLHIG